MKLAWELNTNVENVLWYFVTSDSYMKAIEVFSLNTNRPFGPFLKPDKTFAAEDWYLSHKTDFSTEWHVRDGHLYAARTVLDTSTSSQGIGVMRVEFFPRLLTVPVDSRTYMDNGIRIMDDSGRIIYQKAARNAGTEALVDQHEAGA